LKGEEQTKEEMMKHLLKCHEMVKDDIVRGQNCYLYDSHNRKYVDLESGVWCTALGHNHPRIRQALTTQLDQIMHLNYRYTNILAESAAIAVLDTLGLPDGKCIFLSSGSEAVEFGVQITKQVTGKPFCLALSGSYLAAYGTAGSKQAKEKILFDWKACMTCNAEMSCEGMCQKLRDIPFDQIGGFIFEPGNTSGTVRFPPQKLIDALVRQIKHHRGLLVVDEVTTGVGRTGRWYGFEHYGLQPDVIALGKGLGNGYPVSTVVMKREVAETLEQQAFRYGQSHHNDPLGCVVAQEVITVMKEESLVDRSARLGAYFLGELEKIGKRHPIVKEVRGRGLMIAVEFEQHHVTCPVTAVYQELLHRGFLVGYKPHLHTMQVYPALTIEQQDIENFVENLNDVLGSLN
jgi:acetylornithine aminotransferase